MTCRHDLWERTQQAKSDGGVACEGGSNPIPAAKRFLLVSHDFPPFRTSGVYRATGMAKYLPRLGWVPTVLSVVKGGKTEDPSLLERVPPFVQVLRARSLKFSAWEDAAARTLKGAGALNPPTDVRRKSRVDRWLRSVATFVRSCVYFPDEKIGWVPFALFKALAFHDRERVDVIYTTSPPRSASLVGLFLKLIIRKPWVVEFRDPWYLSSRPLRRKFEARLERLLLDHADAVIVVTDGHAEYLRTCRGVPADKLVVIRNGYDEDDFREEPIACSSLLEQGYLHLTHFGTIYPGCSGVFFPVLAKFVQDHPEIACRLRLNIVGFPDEAAVRYANGPLLKDIVRTYAFVQHAETLRMMRATHCLLLFWGRPDFSRLAIAGKTYEYLRIGRPILALSKDGGVKELVEQGKAGWAIDPDDATGIRGVLEQVLRMQPNGNSSRPARPEFVTQFRYDYLARQVADVLNKVTGNVRS